MNYYKTLSLCLNIFFCEGFEHFHYFVNFLLHDVNFTELVLDELFDFSCHNTKLIFIESFFLTGDKHHIEMFLKAQSRQDEPALPVERSSRVVSMNKLVLHNCFVGGGNDSDQEIQENDQDEVLIEEPHKPNCVNHHPRRSRGFFCM